MRGNHVGHELRHGRQFVESVRELAGESFREAKGWQELQASLSQKGLTLQPAPSPQGSCGR